MAHGEINHIEFPADDPQRAMRFYERQGWRSDGSVRIDRVGELRTPVEEARYRLTL